MASPAMKLTAIAALLVLTATIAEASISNPTRRCQEEMRRKSIEGCRQFLRHGHQYGLLMEGEEANQEAPEQCCRQLRQVSEECRCPMVMEMMREAMREEGFEGHEGQCRGRCGEMMQRGQFLPEMCGVGPQKCRMQQGGGGYY